jgi:hypothetical protein
MWWDCGDHGSARVVWKWNTLKDSPGSVPQRIFLAGPVFIRVWLHCRQVCLESSSIFCVLFVCRKSRGGGEEEGEVEEEGEFGKLGRWGDALEVIFACKEMQLGSKKRHHCLIAYKSSFSEHVNDDFGASGEAGTAGHGEPWGGREPHLSGEPGKHLLLFAPSSSSP